MAWPMIALSLGQMLAGGLLAGRNSGQKTNPAQMFAQLMAQQMGQLQGIYNPMLAQVGNAAQTRGAALGQDMAGSAGALGSMSSGVGRAGYSLGQTAGTALRAQSEVQLRQQMVNQARENAMAMLGPQTQYQESQRSGGENLQSWLAQIMSGGQMNQMFGQLLGGGGGGAPGAQPGGGIRATPNMLPFTPPTNIFG